MKTFFFFKYVLTLIHKNLMWNRPVHDIKLQPAKVGEKNMGNNTVGYDIKHGTN